MLRNNDNLYEQLVSVTADYLGPASRRFVDRQIQHHINKAPDKLNIQDLNKLIDWLYVSLAVITDDRGLIEEYVKRLHGVKGSKTK